MADNPFILDTNEYVRDVNIFKHYVDDSASYLAHMTGKPYDDCVKFVITSLKPNGEFEFKDPKIHYLERGRNGDRERKVGKLSEYINSAVKENDLIAPTLTTYLSPEVKKSLLVDFIDGNVAARGKAKKEKFAAKLAGNKFLEDIKEKEQINKKLANNSLSGAHVSSSTVLNNKTAHSTLTSNCRSTSGYGNANNEKFISGNRHYWSADITRNNIISIINHSDYSAIEKAMCEFGLRHPSIEETIETVRYSTDLYWKTRSQQKRIDDLIRTLSPIERSAFVYTGDLYHLMKFNNDAVRIFITKLSTRVNVVHPDPDSAIKKATDDICNFASMICADDLKKESTKEVINVKDVSGTPAYGIYASTVENIINVIDEYKNLIKAFWVTKNVPASVAYFPESIRRCVVTSDTDSTIFTVQDWVLWYSGSYAFDPVSNAVAAALIFLASQTITHVLAIMSTNFGIEKKRLFQIAMKNEFKFDVFTPTQVAKHYFALIGAQEGNIYSKYKSEIKGVHLKASNAPKLVMAEAKKLMLFVMNEILKEKKLSWDQILKQVGDIERNIISSIAQGKFEYFKRSQIKPAESYKRGELTANYMQYTMWQEVFGPKYGMVNKPPYIGIKISAEVNSPTHTREWLLNMEDRELAARMEAWMLKNDKLTLGKTFILPESILASGGIPKEIFDVVGVRKIVSDSTKVLYIILESLGIYMTDKKITKLVSDFY